MSNILKETEELGNGSSALSAANISEQNDKENKEFDTSGDSDTSALMKLAELACKSGNSSSIYNKESKEENTHQNVNDESSDNLNGKPNISLDNKETFIENSNKSYENLKVVDDISVRVNLPSELANKEFSPRKDDVESKNSSALCIPGQVHANDLNDKTKSMTKSNIVSCDVSISNVCVTEEFPILQESKVLKSQEPNDCGDSNDEAKCIEIEDSESRNIINKKEAYFEQNYEENKLGKSIQNSSISVVDGSREAFESFSGTEPNENKSLNKHNEKQLSSTTEHDLLIYHSEQESLIKKSVNKTSVITQEVPSISTSVDAQTTNSSVSFPDKVPTAGSLEKSPSVTPIDKVSSISPLEKVSSSSSIKEISSVSPLEEVSSIIPLKEVLSVSPLEEVSSVSLLKEASVNPLEEVPPVSPLKEVSSVSPLKKVSVSPLEEVSALSPLEELSSISPLKGDSSVSPLEELSSISLLKEVSVSPPMEETPTTNSPKQMGITSFHGEPPDISFLEEKTAVSSLREASAVSPLRETLTFSSLGETPPVTSFRETSPVSFQRVTPAISTPKETPTVNSRRETTAISSPEDAPAIRSCEEITAISSSDIALINSFSEEAPAISHINNAPATYTLKDELKILSPKEVTMVSSLERTSTISPSEEISSFNLPKETLTHSPCDEATIIPLEKSPSTISLDNIPSVHHCDKASLINFSEEIFSINTSAEASTFNSSVKSPSRNEFKESTSGETSSVSGSEETQSIKSTEERKSIPCIKEAVGVPITEELTLSNSLKESVPHNLHERATSNHLSEETPLISLLPEDAPGNLPYKSSCSPSENVLINGSFEKVKAIDFSKPTELTISTDSPRQDAMVNPIQQVQSSYKVINENPAKENTCNPTSTIQELSIDSSECDTNDSFGKTENRGNCKASKGEDLNLIENRSLIDNSDDDIQGMHDKSSSGMAAIQGETTNCEENQIISKTMESKNSFQTLQKHLALNLQLKKDFEVASIKKIDSRERRANSIESENDEDDERLVIDEMGTENIVIAESENKLIKQMKNNSPEIIPLPLDYAERVKRKRKMSDENDLELVAEIQSAKRKHFYKNKSSSGTPDQIETRVCHSSDMKIGTIDLVGEFEDHKAKQANNFHFSSPQDICEKCKQIWNDEVLNLLFEGNESVTIKSRITYGAIICMNNYVAIHYPDIKEEALRGLLSRADLAKNIGSLPISLLNGCLLALITENKVRCCDPFRPMYKHKNSTPIKLCNGDPNMPLNFGLDESPSKDLSPTSQERSIELFSHHSTTRPENSVNDTSNMVAPLLESNADSSQDLSDATGEMEALDSDSNQIVLQTNANEFSISKAPSDSKYSIPINENILNKSISKVSQCLFNLVCNERESLSPSIQSLYDQLPCETKLSEEEKITLKRRSFTNKEVLNIHSLCILKAKVVDLENYYNLFSQILLHRGYILFIPDGHTLVKHVENLRREHNRKKFSKNKNFLNLPWDAESLFSAALSISEESSKNYPSIREILALFCLWKSQKFSSSGDHKKPTLQEESQHLRRELLKLFKEEKVNIEDCFGLCVRLFVKYCNLAFEEESSSKVKLFLDLFYLPKENQDALSDITLFDAKITFLPPSKRETSSVIKFYEQQAQASVCELKRSFPEAIINYKLEQTKKLKTEILSQIKVPKVVKLLDTYASLKVQINYLEQLKNMKEKLSSDSNSTPSGKQTFSSSSSCSDEIKLMIAKLKTANVPSENIPVVIEKIYKNILKRRMPPLPNLSTF